MTLSNKSFVTIDDLSNGEIDGLFSLADEMAAHRSEQYGLLQGKVMASLFFEPSSRTRLSFETAMHRLGGSVISAVDAKSTSLAKGESIADMARVVGSYADIIVIRHPWEGAARVMAEYAGIPVINAGDGSHEHPTQTLCDLYTIQKERGDIRGLKIALWGDLKNGRTIHSLIYALARFGATILFRPAPGLGIPEHVIRKLTTEYGGEFKKYQAKDKTVQDRSLPLDAIYVTPTRPHQLAMMPDVSLQVELEAGMDALYVTRLQKERLTDATRGEQMEYPVVDKKLLKTREFRKTLVMHPLPRVDELAYELDSDPRSMYFKQAARGVPIRMALLSLLLGVKELPPIKEDGFHGISYPEYKRDFGIGCANSRCVTVQETERNYIKPRFKIISQDPLLLRCSYCDNELQPKYIASADWHEGRLESKRYHRASSHWLKKIKAENLIIFNSKEEAEAHGFKPGRYASVAVAKKQEASK